MPKSEIEIINAHKTTIEALTGKKCIIRLIDKEWEAIRRMSLDEIRQGVEKINFEFPSIVAKGKSYKLVQLRKLFCLFAYYGHTNLEISNYLNIGQDLIRYYHRCNKNHLEVDFEFQQQYQKVKAELMKGF